MAQKNTTNWNLSLSLVTDVDTQVHLYSPDELTQKLAKAKPIKYLTVNGNLIYPTSDFGFDVQPVNHNSRLTNSDLSLNLENVSRGETYTVSLVYRFESFPGTEMADDVNRFASFNHPGRILDIRKGELGDLISSAEEEFSRKLNPFGIKLEPDKTYLRFFMY